MPANPDSLVSLRAARAGDAEAIARLVDAAWRAAYRGILPAEGLRSQAWPLRVRGWARRAEAGGVLVATRRGRVVGVASGSLRPAEFRRHDAILDYLYVSPAVQSRHVGGALLRAFARGVSEAGARSMVLWCLAQNAKARRFYERHGGRAFRLEFEFYGVVPVDKVAYEWPTLVALVSGRE